MDWRKRLHTGPKSQTCNSDRSASAVRASLIISPTAGCSRRGTVAGPSSIYCHASFSTNRRRRRLSQPAWTGDSRDGDLLLSLHFSLLHVGPSRQTGNHNTCSNRGVKPNARATTVRRPRTTHTATAARARHGVAASPRDRISCAAGWYYGMVAATDPVFVKTRAKI